jgi:hypothetical protein
MRDQRRSADHGHGDACTLDSGDLDAWSTLYGGHWDWYLLAVSVLEGPSRDGVTASWLGLLRGEAATP